MDNSTSKHASLNGVTRPYSLTCVVLAIIICSAAAIGFKGENLWSIITAVFAAIVGFGFLCVAIQLELAGKNVVRYASSSEGMIRFTSSESGSSWVFASLPCFLSEDRQMRCLVRLQSDGKLLIDDTMRGVDVGFLRPLFWCKITNPYSGRMMEIEITAELNAEEPIKLEGWITEKEAKG